MPSSSMHNRSSPRHFERPPVTHADLDTPSLTSARLVDDRLPEAQDRNSSTVFSAYREHGTSREHGGREQAPDSTREQSPDSARESGTMRCLTEFYIPRLLRAETVYRLYELFEEELGCEFECTRVFASFGCARDCFPRRLSGPLLVALSGKLHPERRTAFLREACRLLSEYEGTPRVLV
jgi:hypothetical protein